MDNLQAYFNSDSDSDSDTVQQIDYFENPDKKANFFGLESSVPRLTPSKVEKHQSEKPKEADTKTEDLTTDTDIPDGEYWKGFIPDTNEMDIQHRLFDLKRNSDKDERTQTPCVSVRRLDNHRKHPYDRGHLEKAKATHTSRHSKAFSLSNTSEPHLRKVLVTALDMRKIFYVHSKVTPYLTSKCVCKCASKSYVSWHAHEKAVNRLMWNRPNYAHLLVTAGMDSVVKIWNVWSSLDYCVSTLNHHSKAVRNALWGLQGRDIISCSYDRTAIVTDVESGKLKSRYTHPGFVVACALHPSNPHCFITGAENLIQFWDQRTPMSPTKVLTYKDKMGQPQDLLFIQNGNEFISCSDIVSRDSADRTIMAWDVKSGNVISNQIYQERYTCARLKQSPSQSHFLAQTQGGYVALFSTRRPYKIDKNKRFEGHEMLGYSIGFDISHDGSLLYSGSAEHGIHCYDYRTGRLIKKLDNGKSNVITDVACHPVLPSLIAGCTWGGSIGLWE